MGKARARTEAQVGITLDAGALIALERGDGRVIAILQRLIAKQDSVRVPAGVLGQAWRNGSRQAVLSRLLATPEVSVKPLDQALAKSCGELCAATSTTDVIDASVILVARQYGDAILTSDVSDLRCLDPDARLEAV